MEINSTPFYSAFYSHQQHYRNFIFMCQTLLASCYFSQNLLGIRCYSLRLNKSVQIFSIWRSFSSGVFSHLKRFKILTTKNFICNSSNIYFYKVKMLSDFIFICKHFLIPRTHNNLYMYCCLFLFLLEIQT